jgi:SAM-dependent methyltransferase
VGEIFRRETAEHPEPFTGERLTTAIGGQVQIEHYHRYLFARSLARGLDVLDVASGEGYGSALLAQIARSVVGVEYSGSTVRMASGNFRRPNLQFLQGDARSLPLADDCMDLVVSFETIEHFDRQDEFLHEVRRVLRPGGRFIVSTPDRDIYSPLGSAANPFHVHELSRQEFTTLLRGSFEHVLLIRQRALIGSAMLDETGSSMPPLVFDRRGDSHFEACIGLPRAPYLIAVACNCGLPLMPQSIYIHRGDLDTEQMRLTELDGELRQTQVQLARAETERTQAQAALFQTQSELSAAQAALSATQAALSATQAALSATQAESSQTQAALSQTQAELADVTASRLEAIQRAHQAEQAHAGAELRNDALRDKCELLESQHALMQGSMRIFLRGYLPRLRRYLLSRLP